MWPASWIAAGLAVAIVCFLAGGYIGSNLKQGEWDAAVVNRHAGEDAALKAAAAAIAKIGVKSEQHILPVQTEIRTNTVYRDCAHSADSLRNLNALITGEQPTGDSGVPGAHSPD
jgi:hypothetical protein